MLSVLARERLLDVWKYPSGTGGRHCSGGLHYQKVLCSIRKSTKFVKMKDLIIKINKFKQVTESINLPPFSREYQH